MTEDWTGHTIALVGSAGGIGAALKHHLESQGAHVYGLDIITGFDAADASTVDAWFESHSDVDTVIYAAGVADSGRLTDETGPGQIRVLMEANVIGAVTVAHAASEMLQDCAGRFVVLNSAFSLVTADGYGAYSASKAALGTVASVLRAELHPATVTDCLLGGVKTPIFHRAAARSPRPAAQLIADRFHRRVARQTPEQAAARITRAAHQRRSTPAIGIDAAIVKVSTNFSSKITQYVVGRLVGDYPD